MTPKLSEKKVTIEKNIENKSFSTTCVDLKTVFEPYPDPKKSPLGPIKVKNYPIFKSNSKFRNEGITENKSSSTT